jgi:hypothetical protein
MTLEEAIECCKAKSDKNGNYNSLWHHQLYEWLKELKARRDREVPNFSNVIKEQEDL